MNNKEPKTLLGRALQSTASSLIRPFTSQNNQLETVIRENDFTVPLAQPSDKNQHISHRVDKSQTSKKSDDNSSFLQAQVKQNWIMVAVTIVIAIATIVSAIVAYYQWQAMEKTLQVSERAYVGIHSIQMDLKKGEIIINLQNTGHKPTDNLKYYGEVNTVIWLSPGSTKTSVVRFDAGRTQFSPGNLLARIIIPLPEFTPEEANLILTSQKNVVFFLNIEYGDGFGNQEKAYFAYIYVPPPDERWDFVPQVNIPAELPRLNQQ